MSAHILEKALEQANCAALTGPASRYIRESRAALLVYDIEELAALRFSIILTARWEASDNEDPQHRADLRADLKLLRKHYGDKIDEMAMTYGVDQAIKSKEDVERSVVVPRDVKPLVIKTNEAESDDEDYGL